MAGENVHQQRAQHGAGHDAVVVVKIPILHRQQGVDEQGRVLFHLLDIEQNAVFGRIGIQLTDHHRLQATDADVLAVIVCYGGHAVIGKLHLELLIALAAIGKIKRAAVQAHHIAGALESAGFRQIIAVAVMQIAELIHQHLRR